MTKLRKTNPDRGKRIQPHESTAKDTDKMPPVFSLSGIVTGYCITDCEKDEKLAFVDHLRRLSQLTWRDLRFAPRHGLGYEKIARNSINVGIPTNISEEVNFISFRFHGEKAMVGYKVSNIFHIVWLDRSFKVYDH